METPNIPTPLQRDFLNAFFTRSAAANFFLTGDTALAAYYVHHRYSDDLDLFTLDHDALDAMERELPFIASEIGCAWRIKVKVTDFRMFLVDRPGEPTLKIDLVCDAGPQFGEHQLFGNVIVDAPLNIAVNQVTAIFGRTATKDFVDFYFLLRQGFDFDKLVQMAKERDLGPTEFYFAGSLRGSRRLHDLPKMIQPITIQEIHAFYDSLATQLMLKLKPRE